MSKNMYHSPNLSCPLSNGSTIVNLLGVMETDFLNFHDEEHFSTGLYQSELLDDSQSSLLDIVGDDYNRHASTDYTDHSIIWEQDVERELNGDVAVIPMSSQMDSFPKLSSSPPAKDFHKMYSDWQHLAPIETTPSEVIDMLDCFTPNILLVPCKSPEPTTVLPNFDFSQTKIPKTEPNKSTSPILIKTEQSPAKIMPEVLPKVVRKTGGKNLELLKQVVKEEIDLDNSFKSEITSSDELEGLNDNFDITSYVNGEDDFGKSKGKAEMIKKEENGFGGRKFGGCYEKTMHLEDESEDEEEEEESEASEPEEDEEEVEIVTKVEKHEDSEDDCCIDVETVSEQMPVLQARDVNSLWEQFEANEAANPQLPQNIFEESTKSPLSTETPMEVQPIPQPNGKLNIQNENKSKIKQVNPELKQPTGTNASKPLPETLSLELIQKMKASSAKKAISVIPAMPKKPRGSYSNHRSNKLVLKANNESIQLDHDYCSTSGSTGSSPRKNSTTESQSPEHHHLRSNNLGLRKYKCDTTQIASDNSVNNEVKKSTGTTGTVIDDTAIRIGQQIKNAINNENAMLKQKYIKCRTQEFLKNQPTVKNMDGKVMISLLKPNIRNNICGVKSPAIIKIEDKTVINKSPEEFHPTQQMCKKRKLNLEEYKRLRGDLIIKPNNNNNNSTDNSTNNSPRGHSPKLAQNEKYQELIMKMASEILKTSAKSKEGEKCVPITKLEEFIPPDAKKQSIQQEEIKIKNNEPEAVKTIANRKVNLPPVTTTVPNTTTAKQPQQKTYKIRTIVSIGTNTDESFLLKNNHHSVSTTKPPEPQRIAFKLQKRNREIIQQRNKFFDTKSSESEDSLSPNKKETTSNIVNKSKLSEIITPILQNTNAKINSNSLITNINATLLQKSPKSKEEAASVKVDPIQQTEEHGEDKTVIILNKNDEKPVVKTVGVQTDPEVVQEEQKIKENTQVRQYRARRDSSTTSSSTSLSSEIVRTNKTTSQRQQQHHKLSHRTSSSNSLSSSGCSRWSRSRSRSRTHSRSRSRSRSQSSTGSDYSHSSSYSSGSSRSRSRSRSISPVRRWPDRNSRSRQRYSRSRRRSRSSSYRNGYSRTYSRSRSRLRRERELAERERMREVEERRVIYVGKISHDITKADLRRRFQSFGPITNVSVHFRDHGDNYGFVTFQHKMDAYEAVERGNDDPNVPKYDISFGGRRAFCKTRYSDLDNIEDDSFNTSAIFRREGDSFDILLREVQAKLRKRKV